MSKYTSVLAALILPCVLFLVSCGTTPTENKPPEQVGAVTGGTGGGTSKPVAYEGYSYTRVRTSEPIVALTFDDGPSVSNTPRLLEILKDKGVHATFFMIGQNVAAHPDIAKQVLAEGNEIGSHSWSHPNLAKMSEEGVTKELQKTEDALVSATGKKPKYLRPPYGAFTNNERQWVHEKFGYDFIFWDVDPDDWQKPGVQKVVSRVVGGARPGSIILLHDIHADSVTAVPEIIDQLKAKGFKFVTVSELISAGK